MFHQYPITPVMMQLLIQNLWQNIYCADLVRYLYWGSEWVATKHTAMIYWSVWNEVASEAANARRKFWSSSVSLRRRKISQMKGALPVSRGRCEFSRIWLFCNSLDCSPSEISQARILEWIAISFTRGYSWLGDQTRVSCIFCLGRWILYHWPTWEALSRGRRTSLLSDIGNLGPRNLFEQNSLFLQYTTSSSNCLDSSLMKHSKPKFPCSVNFLQMLCFFI